MSEYYQVSDRDLHRFRQVGYVLVQQLLKPEEVDVLRKCARQDALIAEQAITRRDGRGNATTLALSNDVGDDPYSAISRLRRIVVPMAEFLGEEVYHYHHKMMLKEPYVGGAWEWHQDYGYWYDYGCLWPRMASCFVAIDAATRENGCLQVIPESHHLGRLNHMKVGDQTGADPERVAAVLERLAAEYIEMQPGDGLFFHSNLLHCSAANTSPYPRWSLICCYNTRSNSPYKPSRHPGYQPLEVLDDAAWLPLAQQYHERLADGEAATG